MAQFRTESNRTRRPAGGSSLAIVRRWPAPFVERRSLAGTARWAALLDEQDEDHDGWQEIRPRHDEPLASSSMKGAAERPGVD
jgi:hypothetical protein